MLKNEKRNKKIAVLMTCHNRKNSTIKCLNSLYKANLGEEYSLKVYLVDDGSSDGTSSAVKKNFPEVFIIKGNGKLYWNRGMHLAWSVAVENEKSDFYLWLNDDVIIRKNGLEILLNDVKKNPNSIICGAMKSSSTNLLTYGGRNDDGTIVPPSKLNPICKYINGNMVLIHKKIFTKVGILDPVFPHAIGDWEYGLRTIKNGFSCSVSSDFTGFCEPNNTLVTWCNPEASLKERFKSLYSPLGGSHPYYFFIYENKHIGFTTALKHFISIHLRLLFPKLWTIKN